MRITVQTPLTDYELHRSFVGVAGKHTPAARRLHKYLDRKYRATIRRFAKAQSDTVLETLWAEAVESGELAGAYWSLATHPQASVELVDRVYGEVHMLSHLAGAAVRINMQEFKRLQRLSQALSKCLTESQAHAKAQTKERNHAVRQLKQQSQQFESMSCELDALRKRLAALKKDPLLSQLKNQIDETSVKLKAERARAGHAEASARKWKQMAIENGDLHLRLERRLAEAHAEREALEATLEKLLTPDCNNCSATESCFSEISLCGRCILYVGGRARQCAHFRALVEGQNGRFIHHDGGLHEGRKRLGSILPQADVVLCPLDCVSHDAASRVKQFCKRYGKKLVFLPRSSLAAFTRGLTDLAA